MFGSRKGRRLLLVGRKALKYRYTKIWRRAHKKESVLKSTKKTAKKKTLKSERGVVGMSIQDLMRKREETTDDREKLREAALKRKAAQQPQGAKQKKQDLKARLKALNRKRRKRPKR